MKYRLFVPVVVCLVAAFSAVALAGCGDDAEPTPTPTAAPTPTPVPVLPMLPTGDPAAALFDGTPTAPAIAISPIELQAGIPLTISERTSDTAPAAPPCAIEPNSDLLGYANIVERLGCPLSEGSYGAVAINEFGSGPDYDRFMLWFEDDKQIYVLQPQGAWLAYTDTWQEGEPEIACNPDDEDEPTSPPLPRRGFGKLWCTVQGVRETMGEIDREERLCQHAVVQRFEKGRLLACFEDATIRYFRVLDSGAWDMEMVQ